MRKAALGICLGLGILMLGASTADAQIRIGPVQIGPPNNQNYNNRNYNSQNYNRYNYQGNYNRYNRGGYNDGYYNGQYYYPGSWNQPGSYYSQPRYQSYYPPVQDAQRVLIRVVVPTPDAQVWFDGSLTNQGGMERVFNTAALTVGYQYQYTIRARWTQNGQVFDHSRTISMTPGQEIVVDFTRPG